MMKKIVVILSFLFAGMSGFGCSQGSKSAQDGQVEMSTSSSTSTTLSVAATTIAPTTTVPYLFMGNGQLVFDGYPRIVSSSQVDYRVRNWAEVSEFVAVAPGVYSSYNPFVPDLREYLEGPFLGDCVAIRKFFPSSSSTCWDGVR